jgi:hypothetical protein
MNRDRMDDKTSELGHKRLSAASPTENNVFLTLQECRRNYRLSCAVALSTVVMCLLTGNGGLGGMLTGSCFLALLWRQNFQAVQNGKQIPKSVATKTEVIRCTVGTSVLTVGFVWLLCATFAYKMHTANTPLLMVRFIYSVAYFSSLLFGLGCITWGKYQSYRRSRKIDSRSLVALPAEAAPIANSTIDASNHQAHRTHWWTDTAIREEIQQLRR